MQNKNIKFMYFTDPTRPQTVTVARMLEGNTLYVDWCINHMKQADLAFKIDGFIPKWSGDVFNKRIARKITGGRVQARRVSIEMDPEKNKIEQMVDWMLTQPDAVVPQYIKGVMRRSLQQRAVGQAEATLQLSADLMKDYTPTV